MLVVKRVMKMRQMVRAHLVVISMKLTDHYYALALHTARKAQCGDARMRGWQYGDNCTGSALCLLCGGTRYQIGC